MSLDGSDSARHNAFRGEPGSFVWAVKGICTARALDVLFPHRRRPGYRAPLAAAGRQLARMGVQAWPMTAGDLAFLTARDFHLFEDTMASWHGQAFSPQRDLAWLQAHAVVDFLLAQNPGADLGLLAARLNESPNYWFWAFDFLGERISDRELEERWRAYAEANS